MRPFLRQFTPEVLMPRLQEVLLGPGTGTGTGRVLHLGVGNMYGGIETTLVTIARNRHLMPRIDLNVAVLFDGQLRRSLEETGLSVPVLGAMRYRDPFSVMRVRRNLGALLSELKPKQVSVHSPWTMGLLGPFLRRSGVQLVLWMHGPPTNSWIDWLSSFNKPDLVIANSLYTCDMINKRHPKWELKLVHEVCGIKESQEHMSLMYPICDISPGFNPVLERRSVRDRMGCPMNRKVVLITARFDPYKGHSVLLESLALLRGNDWECWLAGAPQSPLDRAHEASLRRRAVALGIADRLRWLGHRTDVMALYAAADVFCQPNMEPEAFGHVFVEAQMLGCPVVTTAMGGALENVETGGRNRLVPRADPAMVAAALEEVLVGAPAA